MDERSQHRGLKKQMKAIWTSSFPSGSGNAPPAIVQAIRLRRMTALSKPGGWARMVVRDMRLVRPVHFLVFIGAPGSAFSAHKVLAATCKPLLSSPLNLFRLIPLFRPVPLKANAQFRAFSPSPATFLVVFKAGP